MPKKYLTPIQFSESLRNIGDAPAAFGKHGKSKPPHQSGAAVQLEVMSINIRS